MPHKPHGEYEPAKREDLEADAATGRLNSAVRAQRLQLLEWVTAEAGIGRKTVRRFKRD